MSEETITLEVPATARPRHRAAHRSFSVPYRKDGGPRCAHHIKDPAWTGRFT